MPKLRAVFLCLVLVTFVGSLHADEITYQLAGSLKDDSSPDLFSLDGQPFNLTAILTNFAPTSSDSTGVDYSGTGTLQLGSSTPTVYSIDFIFYYPNPNPTTAFIV